MQTKDEALDKLSRSMFRSSKILPEIKGVNMDKKNLRPLIMNEEWQVPFFNRERSPEECDLFDDKNGCYPNDSEWMMDIILNLRATVNEDNRVNDIEYYKVRDYSSCHGRPYTQDLDLTPWDKNKFYSILSEYTISRADKVLDPLLDQAMKVELPNGWSVKRHNKRYVIFNSPAGETISITKARIMRALEISYSYIEILTSSDFWDANPKVLKPEDKEALLSLFSIVDTSDYYDRDYLIKEAQYRADQVEKLRQTENC